MVRRSIRHLSLRVLVNGTRGKSSVTEYVAAGISGSQADVMGKVTGIIPTIIYRGKKTAIKRQGVARVQEQVNIIRLAGKRNVKNPRRSFFVSRDYVAKSAFRQSFRPNQNRQGYRYIS